jgi:hypothetical protein
MIHIVRDRHDQINDVFDTKLRLKYYLFYFIFLEKPFYRIYHKDQLWAAHHLHLVQD